MLAKRNGDTMKEDGSDSKLVINTLERARSTHLHLEVGQSGAFFVEIVKGPGPIFG